MALSRRISDVLAVCQRTGHLTLYTACLHLVSKGRGVQAGQGQDGLDPKTAEA